MCLENCLMIGIMMPVGVSLSQHFTANEHRKKQIQLKQNKPPWLLRSMCPAIQSHPVLLVSIRIIPRPEVCHQGDIRHRVFPAEQPFHAPA